MAERSIFRLPLRSRSFCVEEGWFYSRQERSIHKFVKHRGVDFRLAPGTPIVAVADGFAVASYQHSFRYYRKRIIKYLGRPIGYGYGYFVVMYHPEVKLFTLYGHLDKVSSKLKFVKPTGRWPSHKSALLGMNARRLSGGMRVKAGGLLGWSGDSGCTWGFRDYPIRPNRRKYPSWDGPHLHFEVFKRRSDSQRVFFDPFGLYAGYQKYPRSLVKTGGMWR